MKHELTNPVTWGAATAVGLAGYLGALNPFWAFIVSQKAVWFGTITVFASFVAPELGDPWAAVAQQAATFAAILFVIIGLVRLGRAARDRYG